MNPMKSLPAALLLFVGMIACVLAINLLCNLAPYF